MFVGWAWASPRKAIHFVCNCRHCGSLRIDRVEQGNGLGGGGAVEVAALGSVMLAFVYPIGCRLSLSSLSHRSHIDICEHSNACLFRQNQQASQLQLRLHSAIRKTCSRIVNVTVIDRGLRVICSNLSHCFRHVFGHLRLVLTDFHTNMASRFSFPSICASFSFTSYSHPCFFQSLGFPITGLAIINRTDAELLYVRGDPCPSDKAMNLSTRIHFTCNMRTGRVSGVEALGGHLTCYVISAQCRVNPCSGPSMIATTTSTGTLARFVHHTSVCSRRRPVRLCRTSWTCATTSNKHLLPKAAKSRWVSFPFLFSPAVLITRSFPRADWLQAEQGRGQHLRTSSQSCHRLFAGSGQLVLHPWSARMWQGR